MALLNGMARSYPSMLVDLGIDAELNFQGFAPSGLSGELSTTLQQTGRVSTSATIETCSTNSIVERRSSQVLSC